MNMDLEQEEQEEIDIIQLDVDALTQEIAQQQQQRQMNGNEPQVPANDPQPESHPEASDDDQQPVPGDNPQPEEDDDLVTNDINRLLPANQVMRESSVMGVNEVQDEVTRFCVEHNISQHLSIFREEVFDLVSTLVKLGKDELMEMGLKRGQAMKCVDIFEKYKGSD